MNEGMNESSQCMNEALAGQCSINSGRCQVVSAWQFSLFQSHCFKYSPCQLVRAHESHPGFDAATAATQSVDARFQ